MSETFDIGNTFGLSFEEIAAAHLIVLIGLVGDRNAPMDRVRQCAEATVKAIRAVPPASGPEGAR